MRRQFEEVDAHVCVHLLFAVDVQLSVWVDRHQKCPNIGLQRKQKETELCPANLAMSYTDHLLLIYSFHSHIEQ